MKIWREVRRYEIWIFRIEEFSEFLEKYSIFIKKKWERELKMQTFMASMQDWYSRRKIEDTRRNIAE